VNRNTLPLMNAALHTSFLWEGRESSLEETTGGAFFSPRELGLRDDEALLARLKADEAYRSEFNRLYQGGKGREAVSLLYVKDALGCFVRSLVAGNSPFDRYLYKGERAALTEAQQQGLRLFQGRLGCAACHTIGPRHASFTDNLYHSSSVASPVMHRLPVLLRTVVATPRSQLGELISSQSDVGALGRFVVTQKPGDTGRFRTPSLRNVAITAPYFHDGSAATLAAVVEREVYNRGAGAERPIILTPTERDYVVAFLESLTSARYAALLKKPLVTATHASTLR
jgi:cytochrome c peroxidase